jgi:outer membrane protein
MRAAHLLAVAAAVVTLATAAAAQQAAAPPTETGPSKIAFVDVEKAVVSIDEGKARLKELDDWARPRRDELARLGKEINDLQAERAAKQNVASEDAIAELNRRIVAKQREFEDRQRIAKRDFEERQNAVLKDLGEKMNAVVTQYADQNRYTAVFILKPNEIVYLAYSADITEAIIKLYNERYPFVQAGATPTK